MAREKSLETRLAPYHESVEAALKDFLATHDLHELHDPVTHLVYAGGKRFRPILVLLAAETTGGNALDALHYGVAMELLHTFTLVHDDIMDQDTTRRGVPTVNAKWGTTTAILAGDALFALAIDAASTEPHLRAQALQGRLHHGIARLTLDLARGQHVDMAYEKREFVTVDEYMALIRDKTASFMRASLEGGSLLGGAHGVLAHQMGEAGECLGMAFQIRDDVLGVTAPEKETGKTAFSDIRRGKMTLPILKCLQDLPPARREAVLRTCKSGATDPKDLRIVLDALEETGAVAASMAIAEEFVATAKSFIMRFPKSRSRETLLDLCTYSVSRAH